MRCLILQLVQQFVRNIPVAFRTLRLRSILENRHPHTRRFNKADVLAYAVPEQHIPKSLAHFLEDMTGNIQPRVVVRHQNARYLQLRVEPLAQNRHCTAEEAQAEQTVEPSVHRDNNFAACRKHIPREDAQLRGAVHQNKIIPVRLNLFQCVAKGCVLVHRA